VALLSQAAHSDPHNMTLPARFWGRAARAAIQQLISLADTAALGAPARCRGAGTTSASSPIDPNNDRAKRGPCGSGRRTRVTVTLSRRPAKDFERKDYDAAESESCAPC